MQKNSREIPVYHAFFKKKNPGFYRKLSAATIRIIISKYMYRFYFPNNTSSKIKLKADTWMVGIVWLITR